MRPAVACLLLFAACGRPDSGQKTACPHDPSFDRSRFIRVRADAPPTSLRRDLSLAQLASESHGSTGAGKAQGLTEVEHRLAFRSLLSMETARGRTCVWFDQINVDLTPASIQIFVPREYPDVSCESMAILEHEREHERVHRERLARAAREIKNALTAAKWLPARGNPLEIEDRAAAEAALDARIRKVVTPVYDQYKFDLAAAQKDLDRPELYRWVSTRCRGWK
ncbi:MAG: hypothetical protein COV48_07175 [Elusimicrobia bacterium CG11_big_fil_rev_8_21_14_0_20_64_6]|nr:MAG: hypothetical protein COV48_07175 [Elusimicrobia bacterium CG11_big_fil_rev_8_21_14_0_20_64_6]